MQEVQEGEKEKKDEEKEKEKKKEAEPNFQLLENPARVMPAQLKVLTMPDTCRYQPFKPVTTQTNPSQGIEQHPRIHFTSNESTAVGQNRVNVQVRHQCGG